MGGQKHQQQHVRIGKTTIKVRLYTFMTHSPSAQECSTQATDFNLQNLFSGFFLKEIKKKDMESKLDTVIAHLV